MKIIFNNIEKSLIFKFIIVILLILGALLIYNMYQVESLTDVKPKIVINLEEYNVHV